MSAEELATNRPPYIDPLAHVIGDALTVLGDGEYITTFDEDDTFDRVVTVLTERVREWLESARPVVVGIEQQDTQ